MKGTRIAGRYTIHSLLGRGGMGEVYLVTDEMLNHKKRVIKIPVNDFSEKVLIREAELLAQLHHSLLPELIDVIRPQNQQRTIIVMDYIDGETLEEWFLQRSQMVEPAQVIQWALDLCDCFEYLHESFPDPIIFRDLKPSNVMIQKNGTLRLIDFGIARYQKQNQFKDTLPLATIGFASPEQIADLPSDVRSDLYTLGSFMYYLLSGGRYFSSTEKNIEHFHKGLSHSFVTVIHKLLALSPSERYQSAKETKIALRQVKEQEYLPSVTKSNTYAWTDKRFPKLIVVGGVCHGSGSTMAALALSKALHDRKSDYSLFEYPENEPAMQYLLHQESLERIHWLEGSRRMRPNEMMQWISTNSNSLCIVDISSHWGSEGVQRLAARADEIWMVADPYPPRFNHHQALKNMELAIRWREMGWRVHFAANRYHRNRYLHDWLRAFPWKPDMIIPEWPVEDLHRFYAAGTMREFPSRLEKNEPHGLSKWIKNQTKKLVNSQN